MDSMRKEWFNWVAKTRKKMQRGVKEKVTHRAAMKSAALMAERKTKILNRRKREERKRLKESKVVKAAPSDTSHVTAV